MVSASSEIPDISIIIINYNTFEVTCNCIKSIIEETKGVNYELILVDNKSTKDNPKLFISRFPEVKLIESQKNLGFAGGNNLGIAIAKGKYILLLNSDTIILNNAIYKSWEYLEKSSPEIGVLGCKLLNPDKSIQISTGGKTVDGYSLKKLILQELANNPIYFHLSNRSKANVESQNISKNGKDEIYETNLIYGAFMLIRREVLEKAGSLDNDFFMYSEDLEWCNRILVNGFKIIYFPFAEIIHLDKQSSKNDNSNMSRQIYLSQALFNLKALGYQGYFLYILINLLNLAANILLYPFLSKSSKGAVSQYIKKFGGGLGQMFSIILFYKKKTSSGRAPLKSSEFYKRK